MSPPTSLGHKKRSENWFRSDIILIGTIGGSSGSGGMMKKCGDPFRNSVRTREGMTLVEVMIAGSIMMVIFYAVSKMSLDGMRAARTVESKADESDLRMQVNTSLRDAGKLEAAEENILPCIGRIKTADGKTLTQMPWTEARMKQQAIEVVAAQGVGNVNVPGLGQVQGNGPLVANIPVSPTLALGSIQLAQNIGGQVIRPNDLFGPRVKLKSISLAWDRDGDGNIAKKGTDLYARIEVKTDRGDVAGLKGQTVSIPLTLQRDRDEPDAPVTGCFSGDAIGTGDKSPFLVVAQSAEQGGHCIGTTDIAISECLQRVSGDQGGTVYLKAGIYEVQNNLSIGANVRLLGGHGSVIKFSGRANLGVTVVGDGARIDGVSFDLTDSPENGEAVHIAASNIGISGAKFFDESGGGNNHAAIFVGNQNARLDSVIENNVFEGFVTARRGVITNAALGRVRNSVRGLRISGNRFITPANLRARPGERIAIDLEGSVNQTFEDLQIQGNMIDRFGSGIVLGIDRALLLNSIISNNVIHASDSAIDVIPLEDGSVVARAGTIVGVSIIGNQLRTSSTGLRLADGGESFQVIGNSIECLAGQPSVGILVAASTGEMDRPAGFGGGSLAGVSKRLQVRQNTLGGCRNGVTAASAIDIESNSIIGATGAGAMVFGIQVPDHSGVIGNRVENYLRPVQIGRKERDTATLQTVVRDNVLTRTAAAPVDAAGAILGCAPNATSVAICIKGPGQALTVNDLSSWADASGNRVSGYNRGIVLSDFNSNTPPHAVMSWVDITRFRFEGAGADPVLSIVADDVRGVIPDGLFFSIGPGFASIAGNGSSSYYKLANPVGSILIDGESINIGTMEAGLNVDSDSELTVFTNMNLKRGGGNVPFDCKVENYVSDERENVLGGVVALNGPAGGIDCDDGYTAIMGNVICPTNFYVTENGQSQDKRHWRGQCTNVDQGGNLTYKGKMRITASCCKL